MKYWVSFDFPVPPVNSSCSRAALLPDASESREESVSLRVGIQQLGSQQQGETRGCSSSIWADSNHGWPVGPTRTGFLWIIAEGGIILRVPKPLALKGCLSKTASTRANSQSTLLCFWLLFVLSDWMQCPLILCLQSNQQALLFLQGSTPATACWHRSQASSSAWRQIQGEQGMVR